jgi:septal ring factor EnvC (AmiA/AmiB activator)
MNVCIKPILFVALCSLACSVLPPALYSQDSAPAFSAINENLDALESLITDTLSNSETQKQQLQDLQQNLTEQERILSEREASIAAQESLLAELRRQLSEMSQTYKAQSALSAKYERSSRFWKKFTLIGVPAAALISGGIVAAVMAR